MCGIIRPELYMDEQGKPLHFSVPLVNCFIHALGPPLHLAQPMGYLQSEHVTGDLYSIRLYVIPF